MSEAAVLGALLRAAPLCGVLPLPGLWARVALAIVLAAAAQGVPGAAAGDGALLPLMLRELVRGLALGLFVGLPVLAARWAGGLIGDSAARRGPAVAALGASVLGWLVFSAAGGATLLVDAFLRSYARWPLLAAARPDVEVAQATAALGRSGAELIALAARLALPALLVLACVELAAGLLARFERGAIFEPGAESIARALRPVLVLVLLAASVAAFTHGVGAAVLDVQRSLRAQPSR
jgi:type III secretory pathway component EscT